MTVNLAFCFLSVCISAVLELHHEIRGRFRASTTDLDAPVVFLLIASRRSFSCSYFFVCASVVSYVAFVLSLFVSHLSFVCVLEKPCFVIHHENTPI